MRSNPTSNMQHSKSGFTLVELLVVITIIGILIALLLPAVQAAREAARRAQCSNNEKQVGLAMQLHLEAKGYFPPGEYVTPGGKNNHGLGATWAVFLLPYLEQQVVYEKLNWIMTFGDASYPNRLATSASIPVLRCPSQDPVKDWYVGDVDAFTHYNYAANNGLGPMLESWSPAAGRDPKDMGVFYLGSNKTPGQISDGLSNTVFVSEVRAIASDDFRGMHYGEGILYHYNYTPNSPAPDLVRYGTCFPVPGAPCTETFWGWSDRHLILTARSLHPGGVNVSLGDGSSRFVSDSIALKVWQAAGTPAKLPNEPINGGEF